MANGIIINLNILRKTMAKYRFVHLSDIHFGQEQKDGSTAIHDDIRDQLLKDCAIEKDKSGNANGVLLTGDTVYSGKEEEFSKMTGWLEKLTDTVGCQKIAVNVVPGNHDIDNDKINRVAEITQKALCDIDLDKLDGELEKIFQGDEAGNPLLPKFRAYRKFALGFECDFGTLQKPIWGKIYEISNSNFLNFVGLNSVLIADKKYKKGPMILGSKQYVIPDKQNFEYVVMLHHPIHWFRDAKDIKPYFKRARVVMVGHEHELEITKQGYTDGTEQLVIFAGATNPSEVDGSYQYRYNWIEFEHRSNADKELLIVKVIPKVWEPSQTKFVPDTVRLGGKESEEFTISCPNFVPAKSASSSGKTTKKLKGAENDDKPEKSLAQEGNGMKAGEEAEKFAKLRYFFWRYLEWSERLKILVSLDLLPSTLNQPVPQTLEKLALEKAQDMGKLKELWQAIMDIVPEEKREENPFL